ncbi:MAG: glycosyltransferase [Acidimicrobiales bacterium]
MTSTVAYLTKRFPRLSETFILDEILGLEAAGVPLRLYAVAHPGEETVQPDVARVKSQVAYLRAPGGWRQSSREVAATVAAHARLLRRSPQRYLGVVAYIARKRRHLSTMRNFAQAGRLALLLEADGASHLHAAFAHGPASVAHFVHLLTGLPYSFSAHAKDIYVSAPDLLARKVGDASFVLTCSQSAADAMAAFAGPDAAKVLLAHHGVDTRRFAPHPGTGRALDPLSPLRVLAVGRLVAKKGYPVLLEALAALTAEGRPVSCTLIGAGPDRAELEAMAGRLDVSSLIRFLGSRTHQQVADSYREADVFVQASVVLANGDRDGIPNSLLEAMASGLAVVASDVAGIPEVVVPGCGLLVPSGDPAALAAALGHLASDPALRSRLGSAARRHVVSSFDRTACAQAIAPLFGASPGELEPIQSTLPAAMALPGARGESALG